MTTTLAAMYHPPAWATGYISGSDAAFIAETIAREAPRAVLEIGVASGASSAAILHALDALPAQPGERVLHSCDVRATCYFDERYATGQACREMYPHPRAAWHLDCDADARRFAARTTPGSIDLAFIDANHAHPWPLLDLLHLWPVMRPDAWIVLHDIELPIQHPEFQVYGPRWLFEAWPGEKVQGVGRWTSIGAVRLPRAADALIPMATRLLQQEWEHPVSPEVVALPAPLASVQAAIDARTRLASTRARRGSRSASAGAGTPA